MDQEKIALLREQTPVGIRHAITLLERTGGNVSAARELFEAAQIQTVAGKAGVPPETAARHLQLHGFDISAALQSIDRERYTVTELILRKHAHKPEEAVSLILLALEKVYSFRKEYWIQPAHVADLNEWPRAVALVYEWISCKDYEGFDTALHMYPELMATLLQTTLELEEGADLIRRAHMRVLQLDEQCRLHGRPEVMYGDPELDACEKTFHALCPVIMEKLYALIQTHVTSFP
ncbi:hypothetical protein [Chitinophaga solisilvae]|uniref:hypothetical protein n=1 Tax=Chitinophaga solisilvae TaxID=1233460 RepID=UPI00136B6244|nr:hypothetical protein [Chitinophaga solisilvae]